MTALLWLLVGVFVGFDVAIAYAWLTIRHERRSRELRWRAASYTADPRKPW